MANPHPSILPFLHKLWLKLPFWMLQLGMMFDIPGLSRRAGLEGTALFTNILAHADRALMVTLFAGLIVLAWREAPDASYERQL